MSSIYLDHNATAPLRPEAAAIWREYAQLLPAQNPSSLHQPGQAARKQLRLARESIAADLGCTPGEIIFTAGGSESNALALLGIARTSSDDQRTEIFASGVEHPSVMAALDQIRTLPGRSVGLLPVDADGVLDLAGAADRIGPGTRLVSVMLANNETGVVQPVAEVVRIARGVGAMVHCDATQAVGRLAFSPDDLGIDLLSLGGHKFGAGLGFGLLYVRRGVEISPLYPGHQEGGRRAGTENVAAAMAAAAALRAAVHERAEAMPRLARLRDRLQFGLETRISGMWVNGGNAPRLCNTLNVGFEGVEGEALVIALDLAGIAASSGAACASGTLEPSSVLVAMGQDAVRAAAAVRFSLGPGTDETQIDRVIEVLPDLVAANREVHSSIKPSTS